MAELSKANRLDTMLGTKYEELIIDDNGLLIRLGTNRTICYGGCECYTYNRLVFTSSNGKNGLAVVLNDDIENPYIIYMKIPFLKDFQLQAVKEFIDLCNSQKIENNT